MLVKEIPDGLVSPALRRCGEGASPGRLTEVLKTEPVDPSTYCYLCGNSDMIYEVFGILKDQGVSR